MSLDLYCMLKPSAAEAVTSKRLKSRLRKLEKDFHFEEARNLFFQTAVPRSELHCACIPLDKFAIGNLYDYFLWLTGKDKVRGMEQVKHVAVNLFRGKTCYLDSEEASQFLLQMKDFDRLLKDEEVPQIRGWGPSVWPQEFLGRGIWRLNLVTSLSKRFWSVCANQQGIVICDGEIDGIESFAKSKKLSVPGDGTRVSSADFAKVFGASKRDMPREFAKKVWIERVNASKYFREAFEVQIEFLSAYQSGGRYFEWNW